MSFSEVSINDALRLMVNGERLCFRKSYQEITSGGENPQQFTERILSQKNLKGCTVEIFRSNGTGNFRKTGEFYYNANQTMNNNNTSTNLSNGYEALMLRQYEKWYNEEVDKTRVLRRELEDTSRELTRCQNELQLYDMKKNLELQQRDMELQKRDMEVERSSKQGLDGIMDTIEKNTFLQGLIEKVVDNFTKKPNTPQITQVDDPDIQQAITDSIDAQVKLATTDKEHFAFVSLIMDKVFSDKQMAQYIYQWMNAPKQEPSVA